MVRLKSKEKIRAIEKSAGIVAGIFQGLQNQVRPSTTTLKLDRWIGDFIRKRGARSAFKGYRGYPAESCISVNEEVVHGIPSTRELREGDIVSIDVGVRLDCFYADAATTFPVGKISAEKERLIEVTRKALYEGIKQVRIGNRIGDVSFAIQRYVERHGYSVVRTLCGHGVGEALHEDPVVPNFGRVGQGEKLQEGMVLAIEPMVNQGEAEVKVLPNKWTVITADGSLSAHFEHSVALVDGGLKVLTNWEGADG